MKKLKLYLDTTIWNFSFVDDAPQYQMVWRFWTMKKIKFEEPKSLLEVRAWKRKVSDEMNRLGIEQYNKRNKRKIDAIIRSVCKTTLTPPVHPREKKLARI